MHKKLIIITTLLCCCFIGTILLKINILDIRSIWLKTQNTHDLKSDNTFIYPPIYPTTEFSQYNKYINVPATNYLPDLSFELTGAREHDTNLYYPIKLTVKTNDNIIQEIKFDKDNFAPCVIEDFGFEYGDFRFDGYGGFKILSSSMGKNPLSFFWIWDEDENCFVEYPELIIFGYITFDYNNKLINVSNTVNANYHELATYKYINDKLTLIKKVIDADHDGYRKVYELINGELELIEITESQLK